MSARCLSCRAQGRARESNQVDLHAERQRDQIMAQLQRSLADPRDLDKSLKVVTIKVGKPGAQAGADGAKYSTREAGYGFALPDVALVHKGISPRHRNVDCGEVDFRRTLKSLVSSRGSRRLCTDGEDVGALSPVSPVPPVRPASPARAPSPS